jgi:hypothetical protein
MVPFFVFVVQVLLKIEMINKKKVEEKNASRQTKIKSKKENIKKFLVLLVPLTTVIFVSFYSVFAIRFYSNL